MDEQSHPQPSPAHPPVTRRPAWVRRSVIAVAILAAVLIAVLLATGNHGPGRHVGFIVAAPVTRPLELGGTPGAAERDVEAIS